MNTETKIKDIPEHVEKLKKLLGIKIMPPEGHFLYEHMAAYNTWNPASPFAGDPPAKVLEIGMFAKAALLVLDRTNVSKSDTIEILKRLKNGDEANVRGVLFEFRTVLHYLHEHTDVRWIGNQSGSYDVEVLCRSGKSVFVEITSKKHNYRRMSDTGLLLSQIKETILDKFVQVEQRTNKCVEGSVSVIVIYFPEALNWNDVLLTEKVCGVFGSLINDQRNVGVRPILNGIVLVSHRDAQRIHIEGNEFWESQDSAYHIRNPYSDYPYPADFSPILKLR